MLLDHAGRDIGRAAGRQHPLVVGAEVLPLAVQEPTVNCGCPLSALMI
jgi:hypothetical protein